MTPEQIKQRGFEKIESVNQLGQLPPKTYQFLMNDGSVEAFHRGAGQWWRGKEITNEIWLMNCCIGFRGPDAVPELEAAGGFEKKTHFWGVPLSELMEFDDWLAKGTAKHIRDCHTHIDQQAAEIARLREELAQLQSSREWVAIESAEQLDDATAGTYEVIDPSGVLTVAVKRKTRWTIPGFSLTVSPEDFFAMRPPHYRLITRAEDFTPPERKIKIAAGEYSREQLQKMLEENE